MTETRTLHATQIPQPVTDATPRRVLVGTVAPSFSLPSNAWQTIDEHRYRGRVPVVLVFLASHRFPTEAVASLASAQVEFGKRRVQLLVVATGAMADARALEPPDGSVPILADGDGSVTRSFEADGEDGRLHAVLLDAQGIIRARAKLGEVDTTRQILNLIDADADVADAERGRQPAAHAMPALAIDIDRLRLDARAGIADGPITEGYHADRAQVVDVLNQALATELVCMLRYKRHYFTAVGLTSGPAVAEFLEHATEELGHADLIAGRIAQLGGTPNFDPRGLADRSHSEYVPGETVDEMVHEDLVAERVGIAAYQAIIRWLGDADPTTRVMLEGILAVEEKHAEDLATLLATGAK